MNSLSIQKIAIIGGGPSALFLLKHLIEEKDFNCSIDIFESQHELGAGMPYSKLGSCKEHLANVSANEIPPLLVDVDDWIMKQPPALLQEFHLDKDHFHQYKVLPRLLLGKYLRDQFHLLISAAGKKKINVKIHLDSTVTDIIPQQTDANIKVEINKVGMRVFDTVIICTGHTWPKKIEEQYKGYFDSPYPPEKLKLPANYPIAIRGSSLTAIDAIRTLARQHGKFIKDLSGKLIYQCDDSFPYFKIVMHSIDGLLPAIRFHLEDPQLKGKGLLTEEAIEKHREHNNGFVSLDFIFENDFKAILKKKDPVLYDLIKEMNLEAFVEKVMSMRDRIDPFLLFKAEYDEALKSIKQKKSIHWKELLAILSGALNYPAKYLSAEDMLRLKKVLLPLISIVIASVPQSSCEELLAIHEAARLQMVSVNNESKVIPQNEGGIIYEYVDAGGNVKQNRYRRFVDCVGQQQLSIDEFPFRSMVKSGDIKQASVRFRSAAAAKELIKEKNNTVFKSCDNQYFLQVPGIAITDSFEILDEKGTTNNQVYVMAVPFIGGYNPDYSGLGFCNEAAGKIVANLVAKSKLADLKEA